MLKRQSTLLMKCLYNLNAILWNTLLGACRVHANVDKGRFTRIMFSNSIKANEVEMVTFICILKACGSVNDLDNGMMLHYEILKCGWELNELVGSALICMYAKCGQFHDAQRVFDKLESPDEVSWGVMIDGYAENNQGNLALILFENMLQMGILSNKPIFLSSLKACGSEQALKSGRIIHGDIVSVFP